MPGEDRINIPFVLRAAADSIEATDNTKPVETGRWRTLTITYMVRDNSVGAMRPQDLSFARLTDELHGAEPVVLSEGQEARQETS